MELGPYFYLLVALVLVTTVVATRLAARFAMALVTASLLAIVAFLRATAFWPNRICHNLQHFNRGLRIIASDDQVARPWAFFGCPVSDYHTQARAGMNVGREGVIDELPMGILVSKGHARHVEFAVPYIAD